MTSNFGQSVQIWCREKENEEDGNCKAFYVTRKHNKYGPLLTASSHFFWVLKQLGTNSNESGLVHITSFIQFETKPDKDMFIVTLQTLTFIAIYFVFIADTMNKHFVNITKEYQLKPTEAETIELHCQK